MFWDSYDKQTLFITGTTGFVGSSLLWRLFTKSTPQRVYVLCRGGEK